MPQPRHGKWEKWLCYLQLTELNSKYTKSQGIKFTTPFLYIPNIPIVFFILAPPTPTITLCDKPLHRANWWELNHRKAIKFYIHRAIHKLIKIKCIQNLCLDYKKNQTIYRVTQKKGGERFFMNNFFKEILSFLTWNILTTYLKCIFFWISKESIILRPWRLFRFNSFFFFKKHFFYSFILKITAFEKMIKNQLNLNYRHGRKIIDFSEIQKMILQ